MFHLMFLKGAGDGLNLAAVVSNQQEPDRDELSRHGQTLAQMLAVASGYTLTTPAAACCDCT